MNHTIGTFGEEKMRVMLDNIEVSVDNDNNKLTHYQPIPFFLYKGHLWG